MNHRHALPESLMNHMDTLPESFCRVVLVRHAAPKGSGTLLGQQDVPLSTLGRRQLKPLVVKLSGFRFDAAFSSDLRRAQNTGLAVVAPRRLKLETRPGLREIYVGRWQGLSWQQIRKRHARSAALWLKRFPGQPIPGAELLAHFKSRVRNELRSIVAANRGRCILVVTHAGVIRVALAHALGITDRNMFRLAVDYCGVNVLDHSPDGVTVRCVNG